MTDPPADAPVDAPVNADVAAPRISTMRRDILSAYAASGMRVVSWALVSAMVYRRMGAGAFATITLVRATVAVLNYASLGLAPAMISRLASAAVRALPVIPLQAAPADPSLLAYADPEANRAPKPTVLPVQTLYFSGLTMLILAASVGGLLLFGYAMLFKDTIDVVPGLRDEIVFVVLAMGAGVLLRLVSDASGAVLQSSGRIATDNLILAASELLWLGLCAAWITSDPDHVTWVAGAFAIAGAFQFVARFIAAEFVAPLTNIEMDLDWRAGREMLGYGLLVSLAQLSDYLYAPADFLLINQMLEPAAVAHFAPIVQIDGGLLLLVSGLAGVLLPKAALAHAAGDATALRRYYVRATLVSLGLLMAGAAAVWALSPWIFRLWLGDDMPVTRSILPVVLISTVIGGSGMVGRSILIGTGRARIFMIAALVAGVANVVLSVAFVLAGLGLRGIVYATVLVVVARAGVWLPWYVMRTLRASAAAGHAPGPSPQN